MSSSELSTSCRFSTRISLRWLPEKAQETTDTIVMSVKDWYLDLRMDKNHGGIDWAIAGQRVVQSQEPLRVAFTHELDSHNAFESVDCGTFVSLPNGDELETGSMPRPDLPGAPVTDYEEVWRELPFKEGPEGPNRGISWILESDDSDLDNQAESTTVTKTFLGRIWGTFLALQQEQTVVRQKNSAGDWVIRKSGNEVSARREEWNAGWQNKYVVGAEGALLPSMKAGLGEEGTKPWRTVGEKIVIKGKRFIVRAFEEIQ
ncbi:hypothetical protein N7468_000949 [Penicillium chermesinum]|uniref:Protein HRI1 n=1 Tax=Penicillium chermesinum TaxID=63820 RepID=A0A9W9PHF5_9EURO|nr:uncharacterized protein N7468_000949 [Penicillium chermesinum]KAJ5245966.1 hypothetical protein N7468_000949 [Penicillium chermesinum]KAJ6144262.1 hypothetical protein N7470_008157 [Penicillium chermesinum]